MLQRLTRTWFLTDGHRTRSRKDGSLLVLASWWRNEGMEVNQGMVDGVAMLGTEWPWEERRRMCHEEELKADRKWA